MKKTSVVVIALSLAVFMSPLANAGNKMTGSGFGNCAQVGAAANSDPFRKFQADTIDLRQDMMTKRFEMQRENLKATPDVAKIAALQAEIKVIQGKIQALRTLAALPADKCDGECLQSLTDCDKKNWGGCNKKSMGGCGKSAWGCNSVPCGQR